MTTSQSLGDWLGDGAVAGVEAAEALARLRNVMFDRDAQPIRLGRYTELEPLGRGGMGVVYRARDEVLGRPVALKVLRVDHAIDRRRLVSEARAMAQLNDDHVVRVFDVGEHEEETFVAMELIEGKDAAAWLAETPRDAAAILEMFVAAGRGLAAAHAVGIVHRDFKPSNVLVGDDGRVRVADFGLAGAIADAAGATEVGRPSDGVSVVASGQVGTPRYMPPEQRRGEAADHRADQWSFAAALWEALFGRRDDLRAHPTSVSPNAEVAGRVVRALRRALQDDSAARFGSMNALLAQLQPRPRRAGRRASLLVAAGLGTVGVAAWSAAPDASCDAEARLARVWSQDRAVALEATFADAGDVGRSAWGRFAPRLEQWRREWVAAYRTQCDAATRDDAAFSCLRRQLAELDAVAAELARGDAALLAKAAAPLTALGRPETCADTASARPLYAGVDPALLDAHDQRLATVRSRALAGRFREAADAAELALGAVEHPQLVAEAQLQLGLNRRRLGDAGAEASLQGAYYHGAEVEDAALAAEAAVGLLIDAQARADYEAADRWAGHAKVWADRVGGSVAVQARVSHADSLEQRGEHDAAAAALAEAWDACGQDDRHPRAHRVFNQQGLLAIERGEYAEALALFRRATDSLRRIAGDDSPLLADGLSNIGNAHYYLGDYGAAERAYGRTLTLRRSVYGDTHAKTALALMNLGIAVKALDHVDEALPLLREAVAVYRATAGDEHPDTGMAIANVAIALHSVGDDEASLLEHRRALRIFEAAYGTDHPRVRWQLSSVASALLEVGRIDEAMPLYSRVLAMARAAEPEHPRVAEILYNIALAKGRQGDHEGARAVGLEALEVAQSAFGPEHPVLVHHLTSLAFEAIALERWDEVVAEAGRARALNSSSAYDRGIAAFRLARGLEHTDPGRDLGALADEAQRELSQAGPVGEAKLADLAAWRTARATGASP